MRGEAHRLTEAVAIDATVPATVDPGAPPHRRRLRLSVAALVAMMTAYVVVFGRFTSIQHSNFGTFGFDMGIFDQGIWLLSRFREPFVTVRGLNYFGNHSNYTTLAFVPGEPFGRNT